MAETEAKHVSPQKSAAPKRPATAFQPKTIHMVIEAILAQSLMDRKGATVPGIKNYILERYKSVDPNMLRSRLKKALEKGFETGVIVRPKGWEESGTALVGRFRVDKAKLAPPKNEKPKALKKATTEKGKAKPKSNKTTEKGTVKSKKSEEKAKSKTKSKVLKKASAQTPSKSKKVKEKSKTPKSKSQVTAKKAKTGKAKKT